MVAQQERTEIDETAGHLYRLDLARWWELLAQHLAHPSADTTIVELTPDQVLLVRSGWDWAGLKSILDQTMAVATTQLLEELPSAEPPVER
jgi:hypothetical protein